MSMESPVSPRELIDERVALEGEYPDEVMGAYALGALHALRWIETGAMPPSKHPLLEEVYEETRVH